MDWKRITKIVTFAVIPALIVGILIYDVVAIVNGGGSEASISSLIISFSYKFPFFTFLTGFGNGVLVGHLFWRLKSNADTKDIDEK